MGELVGYIRVSSVDQNTERQLLDVKTACTFEDRCSGKNLDRPELNKLKNYVRKGDTVIVHDISRMARNTGDLLDIIKSFTEQGVAINFKKENLRFDNNKANPMNELMVTILGAIYQFERSMLLERQREGIAIAKAAGKYKGRKATLPLDKIKAGIIKGLNFKDANKAYGIGKTYFYQLKRETKAETQAETQAETEAA